MSTRRPVAPDGNGGLSQIASPDTIDPTLVAIINGITASDIGAGLLKVASGVVT